MIKKRRIRKKRVFTVLMCIVMIVGSIIFFRRERGAQLAIEDAQEIDRVALIDTVDSQEEVDEPGDNRFVEFGNFWIEIQTNTLDIKAPIVDGVTAEDLKKGVGHHITTPYPSDEPGNTVLSGHRWLFGSNPAYKVFEHLDQLQQGDQISVFYYDAEYVYEVEYQKVVDDDALEILDQGDKTQLTLYTCTPKFTALQRLVVVAKLIEVRK